MQLLDESTLMIILNSEDMKKKSIKLNKLDDNELEYILDGLLLLAKIDLGFETKDSYLEIEIIECSDGIVITVYKLPSKPKKLKLANQDERINFRNHFSKSQMESKMVKPKTKNSGITIFEFKDPESLFLSLEHLKALESREKIVISKSDIYKMDNKYYLISETNIKNKTLNRAVLSEYGNFMNSDLKYRLNEYGTLLYSQNAI